MGRYLWCLDRAVQRQALRRDVVSSRNGFITAEHSPIIDRTPLASKLYGIFNSLFCFKSFWKSWKHWYRIAEAFLGFPGSKKDILQTPEQNFVISRLSVHMQSKVCSRFSWPSMYLNLLWHLLIFGKVNIKNVLENILNMQIQTVCLFKTLFQSDKTLNETAAKTCHWTLCWWRQPQLRPHGLPANIKPLHWSKYVQQTQLSFIVNVSYTKWTPKGKRKLFHNPDESP